MTEQGRSAESLRRQFFESQLKEEKKKRQREMIVAEKLRALKLNHHRNITLLHTALNCTQMMCVMTCSAERGIHQETIELVQKNI